MMTPAGFEPEFHHGKEGKTKEQKSLKNQNS